MAFRDRMIRLPCNAVIFECMSDNRVYENVIKVLT